MIIKKIILSLSLFAFLLVAGCGTHALYQSAERNVGIAQAQTKHAKNVYSGTKPPVVTDTGMYVNPAPVVTSKKQVWLRRPVTVNGKGLPLSFYMRQLTRGTNVVVSYQPGLHMQAPISLNYKGSMQGALKRLAAKSGYSYEINGKTINWSDMIMRTIDISFMPGTSQYLVGGQGASNANAGNSNAVYFGDLGNTENQYSNLHGNLSVWQDLSTTLNTLKSKTGKVTISQATTTVTMYDHTRNVQMMTAYLKKLNKNLSHQVALEVKVLEIDLNKEFNFGIDWNVLKDAFNGLKIGVQGNLAQAVRMVPLGGNTNPVAGFTLTAGEGSKWAGTNLLINALQQQGKVSVVTEPRVVTMNNQMAEIGINNLQGYLAEVSQTIQGTNAATTEALTPGIVKTGLSLYLLPKIKGNKVYLQISSELATLRNIRSISGKTDSTKISVNINGNKNANANTTGGSSRIEVPDLDEKTFNQRSVVTSGNTLVIAGFKQLRNEANNAKMYGVPSGVGAIKRNTETILLITPIILN